MRIRVLIAVGALVLLAPAFARATTVDAQVRAQLAGLRVPFVANDGQADVRVAYYAPTFAGTLFVTRDGRLVYSLPGRAATPGWSLTETLVDGRARPLVPERATTRVSSFVGRDPSRWRPEVATHEQVDLGDVWPGVSVSLRAHGRSVEKIFTVHPGGAVDRIRVRVDGARALTVDAAGSLVARTALGDVTFTAPVAYQEHASGRREVTVAYRRQGREYGVTVGDYDRARPLVIDPLIQSTYLGGSSTDNALALAIHPVTGDVYVAGITESTDFPETAGGAQPAKSGGAGNSDAFVARLSPTLTTLLQATYLGGTGTDQAFALAIHPATGDVYVVGSTTSTNFPGTAGGAQPVHGGGSVDGFVARLTGTLTTLTQATYLGGSGFDDAVAVAIDPTGGVYVAGRAVSINFPGTAGGAQPAKSGGTDGFVARLSPTLTTLLQATYLGGTGTDQPTALAIHPATGDVYVAGYTISTDFPGTAGGAQPAHGGGVLDAFVARLTGTLTTLTQATYLGGSDSDDASALAIHPTSGDVYVAGTTASTNFPGTAGGAQPAKNGGSSSGDAFVARLSRTLTTLIQATYLGGSGADELFGGIAIAPLTGDVYVAGFTFSTDFPGTAGGAQPAFGGVLDAFVARLTSTLTTLTQATYLGGSGFDASRAVAIHPNGDVYVAGSTASTDFPGTAGGAQPVNGGSGDAFVARLTYGLALIDPSLAVPTLSKWGQIAIVGLLVVSGLLVLRRRYR